MPGELLLKAEGLKKRFEVRVSAIDVLVKGIREKPYVKAVDGVSFELREGEFLVLAGESGCGKTTTGRVTLRLTEPTEGHLRFKFDEEERGIPYDLLRRAGAMFREDMVDVFTIPPKLLKHYRRVAQIIFQDPYASLNPRMTVYDIIAEPLVVNGLVKNEREKRDKVIEALEAVKLLPPEDFIKRYPHELSGGQRQRVAIARALVLNPKYIVADEPVSMLDVSIRAGIINLLMELKEKYKISFLFITHDLSTGAYVADKMAIMYLGKFVEYGDAEKVLLNPMHPYTRALLYANPVPDPELRDRERIVLRGEVPSAINPPPACRFHPRCRLMDENPFGYKLTDEEFKKCATEEPQLVEVEENHRVACHYPQKLYGKFKLFEKYVKRS